jgi:acetylornithine deacetylase/succinyl-diaminopimelate desuccinylase-like protein
MLRGRQAIRADRALFATGLVSALMCAVSAANAAENLTVPVQQQRSLEIYKELVEINTVTETGDTGRAADAMAARLRAAGFSGADLQVFKPAPRKGNLVARLRGTGARRPILLLAHIDVVPANPDDWSTEPFRFTEIDGYYYGRGTADDKYMAASLIANLIRYKQEGFRPERDIIVALDTDEEILDRDGWGIQWLLKNQRQLIDAEFALNEGGGVGVKNGKTIRNSVQTTEKLSMTYRLEVKDRGGHSSVPRTDNAIYHLADGLGRLAKFNFPLNVNPTTRAYFEATAKLETPDVAADIGSALSDRPDPASLARLYANPAYNAQLHTTCVATMLQGGHAYNALPQTASAMVNCRIMPGESVNGIKATLARVLADERISLSDLDRPILSMPSALNGEVLAAIQETSAEIFPGVPVVPVMSAGATDGSYLRNAGIPTYGHTGLASDVDDVRSHGRDERVKKTSFFEGQEYLYRLVKRLAGPPQ